MSVMTGQFRWHRHPDSDETFYGIDGDLVIEFEDGEVVVKPGEFLTVPAGTLHRTRPGGARSVNLTFERTDAETVFED
jgi:mannose-6-phosphate isomerase-like protein (cupin superfamily)